MRRDSEIKTIYQMEKTPAKQRHQIEPVEEGEERGDR